MDTKYCYFVVGPVQVAPVASARDLGVYFDSDMTMKTHVTRSLFTALYKLVDYLTLHYITLHTHVVRRESDPGA